MKDHGYNFEGYSDPGYTVISTGMKSELKDIYVALKDPKEYETSITELLRSE